MYLSFTSSNSSDFRLLAMVGAVRLTPFSAIVVLPLSCKQAYVQPLRAVAMSGAQDSLTSADSQAQPLEIEIDNEAEREFTLIRVRRTKALL